jgi:chromate transport protein ChrA
VLATDDLTAEPTLVGRAPRHRRQHRGWARVSEAGAVALSPILAYVVLRIRGMAPVNLPDSSMHTIYIVDPREMFIRYSAALDPTARLREGAQVGFLVVARLFDLGFGAVGGFFATRYLFALIAIVPAYVLLRLLYGIPAGALAVVVLLSSPVMITAWGTDYPNSAVVSYIAGAAACLAISCRARWRPACLVSSGVFLTLAIWSHGMGMVLAASLVAIYAAVRLVRDRRDLFRDAAVLAAVAVLVTLVLMVASEVMFGRFDFIGPTFSAASYLNQPAQIRLFHSANWHWAPYVAYLLVPPAVIVMFVVTFARRLRSIPTPQLLVGLMCAAGFAVFAYLQFGYHVESLEMYYFSSTLWGVICLTLAVILAELCRSSAKQRVARWLPALVLVAVPLCYEVYPHVPAFGWLPTGAALGGVAVVFSAVLRFTGRERPRRSDLRVASGTAVAVVAIAGSLLVLTVAPSPVHPPLSGLAHAADPAAPYSTALGGSASLLIDWYQVSAELPSFVGNATYRGEQLLMWWPYDPSGVLTETVGIYHGRFNSLPSNPGVITTQDAAMLAMRRPAEVLLLSTTGAGFTTALQYLGPYRPVLARTAELRDGAAVLHVWLIVLKSFARHGV